MAASPHDGYTLTLHIPVEWFSGTDTLQSERLRARRRKWVRDDARAEWKRLKRNKVAYKVERFVALIGVAAPEETALAFPSRAAETVKPIIDAGTDAGLWPDDDSTHRCSTIYFRSPDPAPAHHYALTIYILPVPSSPPTYQVEGALSMQLDAQWRKKQQRPDGYGGWVANFTVPHRMWLSSNYTDSDLKARANGQRRSDTWGRGDAFGQRARTANDLKRLACEQWDRQRQWWTVKDPYIILAGIGYPPAVADADPDNCAESVNAIMDAGLRMKAWRGIDANHCRAVAFFRLPTRARTGTHDVALYTLPVPPGFQIAETVADSAIAAWGRHKAAGLR